MLGILGEGCFHKRRFLDVVKEDMADVEVTEEDAEVRNNWRRKIRCSDPCWEKPKEEEEGVSRTSVLFNVSVHSRVRACGWEGVIDVSGMFPVVGW